MAEKKLDRDLWLKQMGVVRYSHGLRTLTFADCQCSVVKQARAYRLTGSSRCELGKTADFITLPADESRARRGSSAGRLGTRLPPRFLFRKSFDADRF